MSEYTDLLADLPVPDHGPDFWSNLEQEFAAAPTSITDTEPHIIDPTTDQPVDDEPERDELAARRLRTRRWLIAAAATAAALAAIVFGFDALDQDGGPLETVDTTTTMAPSTTTTTVPGTTTAHVDPAPADGEGGAGLRSAGLPLQVSPTSDLIDGDSITVAGSGHTPGAQIGVIQCYGPIGGNDPATPEFGNCDLSNFVVATAGDGGDFAATFAIRQHMTSDLGPIDCAFPEEPYVCGVAAGDTTDLTNFGILEITFDAEAAAEPHPVITVSKTEGLEHDELVTVEGRDFEPGELVRLSSCPPGVDGFDSCMHQRGSYKVTAGDDGTFTTEIRVQQFFDSQLCTNEFFSCYLAAISTRDPRPVELAFAGDPSGSTPRLTPTGPFEHLQSVRFDVPLMGATPGEDFTARLCRLDTATLFEGGVCGEPITGVMGTTGATFELAVEADFDGELVTDGRVAIDCFIMVGEDIFGEEMGFPSCAIRVETPSYLFPAYEITFDPSVVDALRD